MLDAAASRLIQPVVHAVARQLLARGVHADALTLLGFAMGLGCAGLIATQALPGWVALLLLLASRACDALDGAVARLSAPTDAGGFLDISLDFLFYAAVPLAFAIRDPAANALAAAVLLAAFMGTGSSFLAFAAFAAKRGLHNPGMPNKSFYFLGGLTEATETIAVFCAMCMWPQHFAELAFGFAALCAITIATRLVWGYKTLQRQNIS